MELVESKMEYCETSDDGAGKTNYDHHDMVDDHDEDYKKQSADDHGQDDQDVPLPGFRFHPTDEELVGFYLRRKVEKRPISIELIKQIDIYKYDPWDLPKGSNVGDKEWYFFCKRGRKYRNSIRPNRVTGSGFWKATGIDRPIYGGEGGSCGTRGDCIGLKKSLVYYRGSAGKGTKTDWMMHEFRLPPPENKSHYYKLQHPTTSIDRNDKSSAQEAEVWTLCRILKRNVSSYKKCIPDWREVAAAKRSNTNPVISAGDQVSSSGDSSDHNTHDLKQGYNISFQNPPLLAAGQNDKKKSFAQHHELFQPHDHHQQHATNGYSAATIISSNQQQFLTAGHDHIQSISSPVLADPSSTAASYSSYPNLDINEFSKHGDWDDLRSVVEFAVTDPIYFMQ